MAVHIGGRGPGHMVRVPSSVSAPPPETPTNRRLVSPGNYRVSSAGAYRKVA